MELEKIQITAVVNVQGFDTTNPGDQEKKKIVGIISRSKKLAEAF